MRNEVFKLFTVLTVSLFMTMSNAFGLAHGEEPACKDGELSKVYIEQADSCKKGEKVKSYSVMSLVKGEDGIEKLRALLEYDCIEGFRNSIGKTIADDWAQAEDLKHALHSLVDSEWFTEDMRDRIGLTEFDVALLKSDTERVYAILDAITSMKDNTPSKNAEFLRFMTSSAGILQYLITLRENYSSHLTSSHIKDPSLDTVVMISGPGGTAWSYSEFNHAIGIIQQLGLNWILIGDGVHGISLEDVAELKPLIDGLEGKLMFWINAHGQVDEEAGGHIISLDDHRDLTKTHELFESLKTVCGNRTIDVILGSCYSGAAYKDAIEVFSEGSRFLSTAPADASSLACSKFLLNGVDHFMKSRSEFNSVFELFSLGYLYKIMIDIDINPGPQIFASVLNANSLVLKLDKASTDFEYVFENKKKIINYLEHYLDGETLELVSAYIDLKTQPLRKDSGIDEWNLSRMVQYAVDIIWTGGGVLKEGGIDEWNLSRIVQYAVGMIWNGECALNEGVEELIAASDEDDCNRLFIDHKYSEYVICSNKKIENLERIVKERKKKLKVMLE